jgi:phosphoesterase RecJ-like protein
MNGLPEILRAIEDSSDILVIAHIQPDGDTLGSSFALLNMLRRIGKRARLYSEDGIPRIYCELFPADALSQPDVCAFDLMIALDCAVKSRLV